MSPRIFIPRKASCVLASLALALAGHVMVVPAAISGTVVVGEQWPTHPDPGRGPANSNCQSPTRAKAQIAQLVNLVNAERRVNGLPALRPSAKLAQVAHAHACDNAAHSSYSHVGSDGSDLKQRLRRGGYGLRVAAENTGFGFDTPERAMNFWMNSPHHRANILLKGITEIGIGLVDGSRPAWVMNLARPR
ncbi:MAG: CAP domain-containing protein [Pseudorhodobacter sp.]|nr:CAP domain-containing protein [Pseudorhodobacter sp.]